jgi:predicted kinase
MVRAKVDCLRAHQPDLDAAEQAQLRQEYRAYLDLAERYTRPDQPLLLLMHGLSGSGKTTVSQQLLEQLPAIRLRSDVERKRLFDLPATADTASDVDQGIYSQQASEQTYRRLLALARHLLQWGYRVIVDAAFLEQDRRAPFLQLARELGLPCHIIECQATEAELRRRLQLRARDKKEASEADIAVLERQLQRQQPLNNSERERVMTVATADGTAIDALIQALQQER